MNFIAKASAYMAKKNLFLNHKKGRNVNSPLRPFLPNINN